MLKVMSRKLVRKTLDMIAKMADTSRNDSEDEEESDGETEETETEKEE